MKRWKLAVPVAALLMLLVCVIVIHLAHRVIERLAKTRADAATDTFLQLTIQESHILSSNLLDI